ncbi:MAG TPA: DUF2934 domain-containing protein [Bryobacteraceae bacterium]|nr:DUF2934 domain-containing protein [Bryobacteraceae bacterium]
MRTSPDIVESHLELEERIRRRAHQIWEEGGRHEGRDLEDWLQAEQEVLGAGKQPAQDRGTVVGDAHTPDIVFSKAS